MGGLADTGEEELNKMYRLNFLTAYHIARQVFLQMQEAGRWRSGHFYREPSGHTSRISQGICSHMPLGKSLVFRLAEVINEEGKGSGITASVIVPGIIDTPQNREAMPDADFTAWVFSIGNCRQYLSSVNPGRQTAEREHNQSIWKKPGLKLKPVPDADASVHLKLYLVYQL